MDAYETSYAVGLQNTQPIRRKKNHTNEAVAGKQWQFDFLYSIAPLVGPLYEWKKRLDALPPQLL